MSDETTANLGFAVNSQPIKDAVQDLKTLPPAAQSAGAAVDDFNKKASATGPAAGSASAPVKELSSNLAALAQQAGVSEATLRAIAARQAAYGVSIEQVAAKLALAKGASADLGPALNAAGTAANSAARDVNALGNAVGGGSGGSGLLGGLGRLPPLIIPVSAGLGALALAAGAVLLGLAKVNDSVELSKSRFAGMAGSSEQGNRALNAVKEAAAAAGVALTTFESGALTASQGFDKAASRSVIYADGAQRAADQSIAWSASLKTIGQVLQLNNADAATDKKVFDALNSSIGDTGTVSAKAFQIIRGQSEGTARAISEAFSFRDVNAFQRQLELTPIPLEQFEQVLKRVAARIQTDFDARPIDSVKQATEELGQEWDRFIRSLSETGAVTVAKDALIGLTGIIKNITDGNWLKSTSISDAADKWAGDVLKALDDGIKKPVLDWLGSTSISDAVGAWAQANIVDPITRAVQAAASAIAGITPGIGSQNNSPGQNLTANPGGAGTLNLGDLGGGTGGTTGGETVPNITAGGDTPGFASGTDNAPGGLATVNEQGGEIVNLPSGSQVIPHDVSMQMAASAGAIQGLTTLQGGVVSATPDPASQASIKQITDAISQSSIDITKQIAAGNDNIVTALKKLTGGVAGSTVNPATGLPVASTGSPASFTTGRTLLGGTASGGGGFSTRPNSDAADYAKFQAQLKAMGPGNATDYMYPAVPRGDSSSAARSGGYFPAGAPINPRSTVPINASFPLGSSSTGYPGGEGGVDARSSLDYGSSPYDDYGSGSTYSATGSTAYGSSSGGSNYSSDYGGNSISGITGNDPNTINYGGGSADTDPNNYGYFATGGKFTVGGMDGIDKNLVSFHATKGETVEIKPPGGVSVPDSVPMPAALSGRASTPAPASDPQVSQITKNITINVADKVQAADFYKSRKQIAMGI